MTTAKVYPLQLIKPFGEFFLYMHQSPLEYFSTTFAMAMTMKTANILRKPLRQLTGKYKGVPVSVMASGMGMPSIGIYSWELYTHYGVENIIRIGSAGSYSKDLDLLDVALADFAYSDSSYAKVMSGIEDHVIYPSKALNDKILDVAKQIGTECKLCHVYSSDVFYSPESFENISKRTDCQCVEMESFALFHNANVLGKNAACLLTISDSFVSKKELSSEDRQNGFKQMMEVALEAAIL